MSSEYWPDQLPLFIRRRSSILRVDPDAAEIITASLSLQAVHRGGVERSGDNEMRYNTGLVCRLSIYISHNMSLHIVRPSTSRPSRCSTPYTAGEYADMVRQVTRASATDEPYSPSADVFARHESRERNPQASKGESLPSSRSQQPQPVRRSRLKRFISRMFCEEEL